ncbi:bifunctional adenosylcobinamide kinase/adenosylcobinamide-phosphate guanylyltransferase [Amorphus sp. 3PC139-8]|uniref:bifunctional adenosylcobinamide kinase/adenosylcobinamide-phosphate guanylyltransferase n=1 Tax=Amorphus sp. 3PC139-8 TaxID=2735676 RepID=UPI00345D4055
MARSILILGGARSGKSRLAEELVAGSGRAPVYLASAGAPQDTEMAARVAHHQARRDARWRTVEEPVDLVGALTREAGPETAILVDCLTLWLANLFGAERAIEAEVEALCALIPNLSGPVVFVSNEVGGGIVPENALARAFRDAQGRLNQRVADAADESFWVVAGRPIRLPREATIDVALE